MIPTKDRPIYLYLLVIGNAGKDNFDRALGVLGERTLTEGQRLYIQNSKKFVPPDYSLVFSDQGEFARFRLVAFRRAIIKQYYKATDMIIDKDPLLEIEQGDLKRLARDCVSYLFSIVKRRPVIYRSTKNTTRGIFDTLNGNNGQELRGSRQTMTVVDVLSALIDEGLPNEDLRNGFALVKSEEDAEACACLLLMHSRFSLFKELCTIRHLKFQAYYVQLAIENDAYDILTFLRLSFPESFSKDETRYIGPLITSFHKSCSYYM